MKKVVTVEIQWDQPEEEQWLCPENIEYALSKVCRNTKFEVKEVDIVTDEEFKKSIGHAIDRMRLKRELRF